MGDVSGRDMHQLDEPIYILNLKLNFYLTYSVVRTDRKMDLLVYLLSSLFCVIRSSHRPVAHENGQNKFQKGISLSLKNSLAHALSPNSFVPMRHQMQHGESPQTAKRAIRCLAGLQFQESCREAFKQLKILTIVNLYIQEVILHAVNSGQTRNKDFHQRHTRNTLNSTLPVHHLSLSEKKPSYKELFTSINFQTL
ncbi:hypothetical protein J6590_096742 [Homalodisca vitripennis]|nr:hypothetical protein J6590_096742 [Homalodisca vitripennis]